MVEFSLWKDGGNAGTGGVGCKCWSTVEMLLDDGVGVNFTARVGVVGDGD